MAAKRTKKPVKKSGKKESATGEEVPDCVLEPFVPDVVLAEPFGVVQALCR
jgi:hypothetical protein